jgi:Predicted O-methyltransferase
MRLFHKHLRRLLLFFLKRHPNLALDVLRHYPNLALDALTQRDNLSFANFPDRPQRNFEDLDWLLVSNPTNRGLLRMGFDEAAFLFRLARSQPGAQILEIGRYYGGSTFLFAVASDHNSMVTSIDIAPQNDELLKITLTESELAHKVQLLVGDSCSGEARLDFYDLILVDGDHSYEGVLKDYEYWKKAVRPGGCLAFHNAAAGRPHTVTLPGPFRLAQEIVDRDRKHYRREPDVGSLALFIRTQWPFS